MKAAFLGGFFCGQDFHFPISLGEAKGNLSKAFPLKMSFHPRIMTEKT